MTGQEHPSNRAAGIAGVVAAALLLLGALAFYATSGEASASGSSGEGSGGSSGSKPPTSVFPALPACRVDVQSAGVGEARRHHVAVVLDNALTEVWLVVVTSDGEQTFHVPVRDGWARLSLDGALALESVAVNGSRGLESFMTGCIWSADPRS